MKKELRHSKQVRSRAIGTLLLALPFGGLALPLSPAQAQPAAPAKKNFKPLSAEQKAEVAKAMTISLVTQVGKSVVALKMDGASLEQVIARVKEMSPGQPVPVEVRGARPVKVSFDLKQARVGTVLSNVACLAGCRLWVVGTGFLIAPKSLLTEAELADMKAGQVGEWRANADAGDPDGGNNGWSTSSTRDRLLARTIGQEVTGGADAAALPAMKVKMTFGDFSPASQGALQQLAASATAPGPGQVIHVGGAPIGYVSPPIRLVPTSPISIDTSKPGWLDIVITNNPSDPGGTQASIGILIR